MNLSTDIMCKVRTHNHNEFHSAPVHIRITTGWSPTHTSAKIHIIVSDLATAILSATRPKANEHGEKTVVNIAVEALGKTYTTGDTEHRSTPIEHTLLRAFDTAAFAWHCRLGFDPVHAKDGLAFVIEQSDQDSISDLLNEMLRVVGI